MVFYPRMRIEVLTKYLEVYYQCFGLSLDGSCILIQIYEVKKTIHYLYDEYFIENDACHFHFYLSKSIVSFFYINYILIIVKLFFFQI